MLTAACGLSACSAQQQHEARYQLSDERMFGITNLDELVEDIRCALKTRSAKIGISFSFRGDYMDDISPFVRELMEFAQEDTGRPDEGDYIRYQLGGFEFSYGYEAVPGGYEYEIFITPSYYSSAMQEERTSEKVQEILELLSVYDSGEYEKIQAVHDYISENVKYDNVHKDNQYYTLKSTCYGALVNNSATCQGISVAVYRLLRELGVDCRVITGTGTKGRDREYHAWNIVCIDGQYYNLDATWDLNDTEEFFLKSDESFAGHERDAEFKTEEFYLRCPMALQDYVRINAEK